MNQYTLRELRELFQDLTDEGYLDEYVLSALFTKKDCGRRYLRNSRGLREHLDSFYLDAGKIAKRTRTLMYETPLEDLPLYINFPHRGVIARWRLRLGK